MNQSKPKSTPINSYKGLRFITQDDTPNNRRLYQVIIKKIIYAIIYTRLDIYFVILELSQHISNPNINYKIIVKYLIKYLRSTYQLYFIYNLINRHDD